MAKSHSGRSGAFTLPRKNRNDNLHRSRQVRPGQRSMFFETLEPRALLATFAEAAAILNLDLNVANAALAINSAGTSYSLTLTGDTWSGADSANVTGNGTPTLTVTAAGLAALDTLNVTDAAAGIAVNFADSGVNSYSDQINVTLDDPAAGDITFLGSSSFVGTAGITALSASTTQNLLLSANSSLSVSDGNLTLEATKNITIEDNAQIVSTAGVDSYPEITLRSDSMSISPLGSINSVHSTKIQPKTPGTLVDVGGADVVVGSPLTLGLTDAELDRVTSESLQIGDENSGGSLTVSAPITSANSLALVSAEDVTVNQSITLAAGQSLTIYAQGTISLPNATSDIATSAGGIYLFTMRNIYVGNDVSLTNPDGGIILHANISGGATAGTFNGVELDGATITTSSVDMMGWAGLDGGIGVSVSGSSITAMHVNVMGFGGHSVLGDNHGVSVSDSTITVGLGAIMLNGFGGGPDFLMGGIGVGVYGSTLSATHVMVMGYGGGIEDGDNPGVILSASTIAAGESGALIYGFGGSPSSTGGGIGVGVYAGSEISATSYGPINVIGYGGVNQAVDNSGVILSASSIATVDGEVRVTARGGGEEGLAGGVGLGLYAGSEISASGYGAVEIDARGGVQSENHENHGVIVQGANSRIAATDGPLTIMGYGGGNDASERNYGVSVEAGGQVLTTGEFSSTLYINGLGGNWTGTGGSNYGVQVTGTDSGIFSNSYSTVIIAQGGGFGEGNPSGSNVGLLVADGAQISNTNHLSSSMFIQGIGGGNGGSGESNYGVQVQDGARITGVGENVHVMGIAGGFTGNDQSGIVLESAEISASGDTILIVNGIGTGSAGGSNHVGLRIEGTNSRITSGDGIVYVIGSGGGQDTSSGNIGVKLVGGNEISATGVGQVFVYGNGGNSEGTGTSNYGVFIDEAGSQVTSNGGLVQIEATKGANSTALVLGNELAVNAAAADITLAADSMDWSAVSNAVSTGSTNRVTLQPATGDFPVDLGGADVLGTTLGLSAAEIASVTAGTIQIGDENTGTITITAAITRAASTNLELISGGSIIFNPGSLNTAGGTLRLTAGDVQPLSLGVDATTSALTALSFGAATDLKFVIDGTTAGTEYSQLNVAGLVDLTDVELVLSGSHTPVIGQSFILIENDGDGFSGDAISGTFVGLPEGTIVPFNGETLQITYVGGDGNDVALFAVNAPPTIVDQSLSVAENSANNTSVGLVVASDLNSSQSLTFVITAGNELGAFAIDSLTGAITVADGTQLDFETLTSFALTVAVTDSGTPALTSSAIVTVNVTDVNEAPVIAAQTFAVAENTANATLIGNVVASDPDAGQTATLTYAITAGNGLGAFTINSSTGAITVADSTKLDYETLTSFSLTVSVTDSGTPGLVNSANVTIDVTPVNDNVPVTSSGCVVTVAENTSAVIDVNATDADLPAQTLLYSISGGVDGSLFSINGATGVVSFVAPPDFEMPADAGADNVYNFEVTVSDGLLSITQAIAVQVTDVGELDFGDAPDTYKTLLGSNGASHLQSALFLGASIDADADGQPTTLANGDDSDLDGDDENGVTLPATLFAGVNANLSVTASAAGKLDAWIDFDRSGTFEEGEKVFASINVVAGANALTIAVPANATEGVTYARFRLSTVGGLSPTGSASDGEVEDYTLQLSKPAPLSAQLVADPQHPGDTLLLVNGSANSDAIIVQPVPGSTTQYRVVFPGIILGPFAKSEVDRIEIHALGGNDSIVVDAAIFQPATIYAGDGNDSVVGGSGDDLIFGEAGIDSLAGGAGNDVVHGGNDADYLYGGLGNDVLIGGHGSDWLFGEGGDDLLIGSNGPSNVNDLLAIQAIWSTPQTLNQRALALASRLNPATVTDDDVADYIYGSIGSDWQIDYQMRDYFFDYLASQDRKN